MGVHGLWKILEPTASPVKLETLRGKTLAIDASIWIYHFLKAMRDPKGTILTAAHIIGFFRRICKLMFFEIKPVFVFDGAAPILKKQTTNKRSERRLGREQNARATANKLLTLQLQRAAASNASNQNQSQRSDADNQRAIEIVGSVPESAVYMDELQNVDPDQSNEPRPSNYAASKPFVKMDQYHLPEIDNVGPVRTDDQRLLTHDELEEYSKHFTKQAKAGFIDTSLIDFHSREFEQMPLETQYQLLNMARLKSRLRMGYSTDELNKMFPNEMDFSKFQINRVAQRNFFTQKLMNLVGMEDDLTRRVSSEKNKEYYLKRTDQGWSLALEDRDKTAPQEPVKMNVDPKTEIDEDSDDAEFEDVDLAPEHDVEPEHEIVLEAPGEEKEEEEKADLTAEDSMKLDELFGFEAQLSRQDLYNKLMDEVVAEEEEDEEREGNEEEANEKLANKETNSASSSTLNERQRPGKSLLFGNGPASSEATGKPKEDSKTKQRVQDTSVPWFDNPNDNFKDMEFRQDVDIPNFVSVEDNHQYGESQSDSDEVEEVSTQHLDQPTEDVEVVERDNDITSEPGSGEPNTSAVYTSEKPTLEDSDIVESSTDIPGASVKENTQTAEIEPRVPDIPNKSRSPEEQEQVETSKQEDTQDKSLERPASTEPSTGETNEEPRIELTQAAAERAEEEAEEDREEEEDIAGMLIAEAEENERFARELAEQSKKGWTTEDQREYETQIDRLRHQFSQQTRDADNVSNEMIQECQELLQLFGIPYITAPAEAEAQCAELRQLKLVDGVVTDDGDTFLFDRSAVVYRNMFSQSKFVEFYTGTQIKERLGLGRQELIDLAFLLGSDYTEGILGIGPVTGVEILAEFGGLKQFAEWWNQAQRFPDSVEVNTSLKRRLLKQFKTKLFLPEDFPSPFITSAYMHPAVDKDATKFNWGTPDLDGLRKFMASTAGWTVEKTNVALLPVVQEAKRRDLLRKTEAAYDQTRLDDFYKTVVQNPDLNSKRAAVAANTMRKKSKTSD